jgi:putative hydrolases of HD superfamily
MDQAIIDLLYEAKLLKEIPRSGYQFLGVGRESIAEHTFMATFIAHVMASLQPEVDALKLLRMCLLHDLPEARTGDLNAVQKKYVTADETKAIADLTTSLPFGHKIQELLTEFRAGHSLEARLAHDADQLSLLIDLKSLQDIGYASPVKWITHVRERMITETGRKMAQGILENEWDHWWVKDFSPRNHA